MYYVLRFPLQQWLREQTSVLRLQHIACLVTTITIIKFLIAHNISKNTHKFINIINISLFTFHSVLTNFITSLTVLVSNPG